MKEYQNFLNSNYKDNENINILAFSSKGVRNSFSKVGQLKKAAGAEKPPVDTYMSMNPLVVQGKRIWRDKEHVGRLKWLYADLDYYNSCYNQYTKKQIVGLLELDYYEKKIPVPTYVVDSGRGLYLLWRIDEHIKAHSRWEKMQRYLCDQLEEFGCDRKVATDSARVLRQIGSFNSKSETVVEIISYQDKKYSLTNLLREYVVSTEPSEKMIRYAKNIASVLEVELPDLQDKQAVSKFIRANKEPANLFLQMQRVQENAKKKKRKGNKVVYYNTEYSLLCARIRDLEKLLVEYRDKEGGCREYILFLYRYWQLCITDDKALSLSRTMELNGRLKHPLEDKEVKTATKSAEKYYDAGKIFRCSNAHVIQALNITEEEMQGLSLFICANIRKKRKRERNRKAYLALLKRKGQLTIEDKIKLRRKRVYALLKKGRSCNEICQELNISRATFYADKQSIECYFAEKKEKEQYRLVKYQEYRQTMQERCLKFSALVLNMSFRTCPLCLPVGGDAMSYGLLARALRSWGHSQLFSLWHNSRYKCLSVPALKNRDINIIDMAYIV